jgi:hypothetical protein
MTDPYDWQQEAAAYRDPANDPTPQLPHDSEEVDQDDIIAALATHAGTLPTVPVVVRGPAAEQAERTREALADAGDRGVLYVPDELGIDPVQLADDMAAIAEDMADDDEDLEPLADAEARQRAATAGLDCGDMLFEAATAVTALTLELRDGDGNVVASWDVQEDGLGGTTLELVYEPGVGFRARAADPGHELGEDPDDGYPDYPCPQDPDGLHYPGCGCEHY